MLRWPPALSVELACPLLGRAAAEGVLVPGPGKRPCWEIPRHHEQGPCCHQTPTSCDMQVVGSLRLLAKRAPQEAVRDPQGSTDPGRHSVGLAGPLLLDTGSVKAELRPSRAAAERVAVTTADLLILPGESYTWSGSSTF